MASFGLLMYGPAQHVWYGWLARRFPGASVSSFVSKVRGGSVTLKPSISLILSSVPTSQQTLSRTSDGNARVLVQDTSDEAMALVSLTRQQAYCGLRHRFPSLGFITKDCTAHGSAFQDPLTVS